MKKMLIWIFVLLIGVSFVFAVEGDDWEDVNINGEDVDEPIEDEEVVDESVAPPVSDIGKSSESENRRTQEFYLALGIGFFGILIVLLFIYLFFRNPKNRWKKKASSMKAAKK